MPSNRSGRRGARRPKNHPQMAPFSRSPDMVRQLQRFKDRSARIAISHITELDGRDLLVFLRSGVLMELDGREPLSLMDVAQVVTQEDHPLRSPAPPGPWVIRRDETDEMRRLVLTVAELLLSEDKQLRNASLTHFERLSSLPDPCLTPRSVQAIKHNRDKILSDDKNKWRSGAVSVFDTLQEDWLYCLAGLRQTLALGYQEGFSTFLPCLLRPSITAIDSIDVRWWSPHEQRDEIESAIREIAREAPELPDALERYFQSFGHLPLVPQIAMGEVVAEWQQTHSTQNVDIWNSAWSWAKTTGSPLARYHLCQVFLNSPTLVPPNEVAHLWHEVLEVIHLETRHQITEPDLEWTQAWLLRCHLAKLFCHHLEVHLPWNDGERTAVLAWWMAERFATLLGNEISMLQWFRREAMRFDEHVCKHLSEIAHPQRIPSAFNYATVNTSSVWRRSLNGLLGSCNSEDMAPLIRSMLPSDRKLLESSLLFDLGYDVGPEGVWPQKDSVYACTLPIYKSIEPVADTSLDVSHSDEVRMTISSVRNLMHSDIRASLPILLTRREETGDDIVALLSGNLLHTLVYAGQAPSDELWKHLDEEEQWFTFLHNCESGLLHHVTDMLIELAIRQGDKWRARLPHFFAIACENCDDKERRSLLFTSCLYCSAALDSVSGLQRLFAGEKRALFAEDIALWRKIIEDLWPYSPPWVMARFRALLAVLFV